eukprot:671560-Prymnesium_polylepis.1
MKQERSPVVGALGAYAATSPPGKGWYGDFLKSQPRAIYSSTPLSHAENTQNELLGPLWARAPTKKRFRRFGRRRPAAPHNRAAHYRN